MLLQMQNAETWVHFYPRAGSPHTVERDAILVIHKHKPDHFASQELWLKYIKTQFDKMARIYFGMYGNRVWTGYNGNILFDTNRGDWIHPEVKLVRKTQLDRLPLLIGRLKSEHGKLEFERRLKDAD